MRGEPNMGNTAKFLGILPIYIGMEIVLDASYLPPRIVRGTPVDVVGIELHPSEPSIQGRASIASHGCVILRCMPKHIYVRVKNCEEYFLTSKTSAAQPGEVDLKGVIAVSPQSRQWRWSPGNKKDTTSVTRTQMPSLPRKQCPLPLPGNITSRKH